MEGEVTAVTFVSHAQNCEDVMLWRALKHVNKGFYVEVGAAHPDEYSVTRAFYDTGWRGINVEPTSTYFRRLAGARPRDINLNVALSAPACTLAEVCREHVTGDVHFLKVDVEGAEATVLADGDLRMCHPWVIVGEATRIGAEDRATRAESRAEQAEARAEDAEAARKSATAELAAVITSTSWRVSRPLRRRRPR